MTTGMEASMITSLGMCKFVMPLAEFTCIGVGRYFTSVALFQLGALSTG
jgi:hypothetical protein